MKSTGTKFIVAKMLAEDIDFVMNLQSASGLSVWNKDDYEQELNRSDSIALVVRNNDIRKGFIVGRLIESNNEAEIYNISVIETNRGVGIGSLLIKSAVEICRGKNIERIWLEVRKSNKTAINFYKTFGFEIITERKNFYTLPNENAYVMKLSLI